MHENKGQLSVVDAYSLQETDLTRGRSPKWSPASDLILFTRNDPPETFIIQPDGSGLRRVGDGLSAGWSASGDRYGYWKQGEKDGRRALTIVIEQTEGKGRQEIDVDAEYVWDVGEWSPAGFVVFGVDSWGMESAQRKYACALDPETNSSYRRCTGTTSYPWSATWSKATLRAAYFYQKPFYGWDEELDSLEGWLRIEVGDYEWMDIGKGYSHIVQPSGPPGLLTVDDWLSR